MYGLLAITTVCAAGKAVICKRLGANDKGSRSVFSWNAGIYFIAALVAFLSLYPNFGNLFTMSPFTLLLAVVFASLLLFTQVTEIKAMSLGSVSMTILIYSGGFVLPIAYGYFLQNEQISLVRGIGILLMAVAMSFIIRPRKEGGVSVPWVMMSCLALIGSGMVAVTQKHHQSTHYADELACFVTVGLLLASVLSLILSLIRRPSSGKNTPLSIRDIGFVIVSGLCIGVQNLLNLYLAGKIPAAVLFPVYNIGSMILTALFGVVVLKEKQSKGQWTGFILGCISIGLIGLQS